MDATGLFDPRRVLVLGDIMLDEYTWGRAERVSPEAPMLVVQADACEVRLGGAGAVGGLLRGLSAEVLVAGVVGDDHEGYTVRRLLDEAGIDGRMALTDADRPTTHKQRFLATVEQRQRHQILRVDHERTHPLSTELGERLAEAILLGEGLRPRSGLDRRSAESGRPAVGGFGEVGRPAPSGHVDAVLISDYAKEVCTPELLARKAGRPARGNRGAEARAKLRTLDQMARLAAGHRHEGKTGDGQPRRALSPAEVFAQFLGDRKMHMAPVARRIIRLLVVELAKHAIAVAVCLVAFVPIALVVTWLAMPYLLRGPEMFLWLVAAVVVLVALPIVWLVYRLTHRFDRRLPATDTARPTTELHELARHGELNKLRAALSSSPSLEIRDAQGCTPLMAAVASPHAGPDVMRCLIEHGADVNAVSTPPALLAKEIAAMKEAGLDTSFMEQANVTPAGQSVLALAIEHASLEEIRLLVSSGADVTWRDDDGYSVLLKALYSNITASADRQRSILEYLIAAGAPLDCVSDYGESVLTVAAGRPDLELVKLFLDRGADPAVLRWNDVFRTLAFGTPDELQALLRDSPSLEDVDCRGRTPFLFAVHCGKLELARLLLEHGCNRSATGCVETTAVGYAIEGHQPQVLQWLLANGWDLRQPVDQFGASPLRHAVRYDCPECVRTLLEAGAGIEEQDEYGFDLMHEASSSEVIWILHEAGLDLNGLPSERRARLLTAHGGEPFEVSAEDYEVFRTPRCGRSNPEELGNPFWNEMVRSRCSAYTASEEFGPAPRPDDQKIWCFDRHGQSLTRLPSGQLVEIGGEHEDYYDPDFCIYRDVVVHDGQGGFRIFDYPEDVFPPTDFHSATFLDGGIYIIGCLGYPADRRPGKTPVYRLDCETWSIHAVPSRGQVPGWIHSHRARVEGEGTILIWGGKIWDGQDLVANEQAFRFDTRTGEWSLAAVR